MNDKHIKIFTVNTSSKTAGLSPANNERIEIFFAGCKMAREGNPCEGCFNKDLWSDDSFYDETPKTIIENIKKTTDNKYITIVGGEPMDQPEGLEALVKELHNNKYHIVLITHYLKKDIPKKILNHINILIDGKYENDKRIFDTDKRHGILHVVGSSNQQLYANVFGKFVNITRKSEKELEKYYVIKKKKKIS